MVSIKAEIYLLSNNTQYMKIEILFTALLFACVLTYVFRMQSQLNDKLDILNSQVQQCFVAAKPK